MSKHDCCRSCTRAGRTDPNDQLAHHALWARRWSVVGLVWSAVGVALGLIALVML